MRVVFVALVLAVLNLAGQTDAPAREELAQKYGFQLSGVVGLNQNGFPVQADVNVATGKDAEELKAKLLASDDAELLIGVARTMLREGSVAAALTHRRDENEALAEQLLRRAQQIEPKNARVHVTIAGFYAERAESSKGERRAEAVGKSMQEFKAAMAVDRASVSDVWPSRYSRTAVEAGELAAAKASGERCLAQANNSFSKALMVHECNIILGRVALREGDETKAGEYLLAAGRLNSAPTLKTFGPNMMLAQELLEKGKTEVVLQYFELCRKFWTLDRQGHLAQWTADVQAGREPHFGTNLIY
jgi:hypothetical protein